MINSIRFKLLKYFRNENQRSQKIIKNIVLSFGVKGGSIVVGLVLVPMTINYISPLQYGIWLTISSIVSWMSFFDIGMGHGLRNKLATALALNDTQKAKSYVSTTYATITLISITLFTAFWFVNPLIDWRSVLNIPSSVVDNIQLVILIVFGSFCIQFIAQLLNTVLSAVHESALVGLIAFIGQIGLLFGIFILKTHVPGSLPMLVIVLTLVPIVMLIIASIYLYTFRYRNIAPSVRFVDFSFAKSILNLGGTFFVIQIGALVLFQTNNIILTRVIGPEAVTKFNVAYKLFSVSTMIFTIVVTPYWSAFTDAYAKKDFAWMKLNLAIMRKLWLALSILSIIVLFLSPYLFRWWLGSKVLIDTNLSIAMAFYVIVFMWQTLHVYFLNGLGKLRIQLILVVSTALINVPLAVFLGKTWGIAGVISANSVIFLFMGVVFFVQTNKILHQKDRGIWAR